MDIVTNTFTHNHTNYRVTSFCGGNMEVYKVEDGLEMYQGHVHEVNLDLGEAAYAAFETAKGQRHLRFV